jgi:hypothetical protein
LAFDALRDGTTQVDASNDTFNEAERFAFPSMGD